MALEWVQEDSEPANDYRGTEVIQATQQNLKKIWHAQGGSSIYIQMKSPTRDGRTVIYLILWQVFKHINDDISNKCKVFVISEGNYSNWELTKVPSCHSYTNCLSFWTLNVNSKHCCLWVIIKLWWQICPLTFHQSWKRFQRDYI